MVSSLASRRQASTSTLLRFFPARLAASAFLFAASCLSATAQTSADLSPSVLETSQTILRNDQKSSIGYKFTATRPLTVAALGAFNLDENGEVKPGGLSEDVEVGLWDSDGHLLSSVTLQPGTAEKEAIAKEMLDTPIVLEEGDVYYVGAYFKPLSDDYFWNTGVEPAPPIFLPDLTNIFPVYAEEDGLTFPQAVVTNQPGRAYLGPVLFFKD